MAIFGGVAGEVFDLHPGDGVDLAFVEPVGVDAPERDVGPVIERSQ